MTMKIVTSGTASAAVSNQIDKLVSSKIASRIFQKDYTLWGKNAEEESAKRLGWVASAIDSKSLVAKILELKNDFNSRGIDRFVLCGMGGSSLAPEVITASESVDLVVLDSTHADQVGAALAGNINRTALIVSSKSGSTVETDSQKRIFEKAFTDAGIDKADRIVVVTDPGSPMESAARADGYRVFNADPNVGGRYSALTAFGIVPSGLAGANIKRLLEEAEAAAKILSQDSTDNPGLILGAALACTPGEMGYRDKIGVVADGTEIVGFGDWVEQLIAESTGKQGKGILPIILRPDSTELHSGLADLLPVHVQNDAKPVSGDSVSVSGSLGEQFLLWEFATAVASQLIGINPFDQPDVESAKIAARGMLEKRDAEIPANFVSDTVAVNYHQFEISGESLEAAISGLLKQVDTDEGYLSIHAYLDRTSASQAANLRDLFAKRLRRPVTFGWGPRFLHSTGQYHKGGPARGVFIQITSQPVLDIQVPGRDFTFGQLIKSQAAGDAKVLSDHGRPVLTLAIGDVMSGLDAIQKAI